MQTRLLFKGFKGFQLWERGRRKQCHLQRNKLISLVLTVGHQSIPSHNCGKWYHVFMHCCFRAMSLKTITYESFNNVVRLMNEVSTRLLVLLPGKATILEGIHGWKLRPTLCGPRFLHWMKK